MSISSSKPKATITSVAEAAGVATGTVSRVFNNHPDVNTEIRRKVKEAAAKLGYVRLRQRKKTRRSTSTDNGHIAIIFFGMQDTLAQLPIVNSAVHGIEVALSEIGRNLMISNIPDGDRVPPFLAENRVEGLIVKGPNQGLLPTLEESELLRRIYSVPVVWLMGRLPNAKGDHCNFDTDAAGRIAAAHFAEKGHQRVAFFNPKPGQSQFEKLKNGFVVGAGRYELEVQMFESTVLERLAWPLPATTSQDNVDALLGNWEALPAARRPTGIFVPSDRTAVQLYTGLARRGLEVGRDVSVISCNNERPILADLRPALTTINVHPEVVGQRAVDQLLWRIRHPQEDLNFRILVEPTLVVRDSVASL